MFQFFPFSNAHQLNLDWILETISKLPWTVNNTYPDEMHNINLPTVAGMSSWNGIGADGAGNVNPAEESADLDSAAIGFHIYHWIDPNTANIPTDVLWFPSGEGYCISCANSSGYICQLSNGLGGNTIATRKKNPGYPWSSWRYLNVNKPVGSNVSLNTAVVDTSEPYSITAEITNGIATIYIECKTIAPAGLGDTIASGLPVPNFGYKYGVGIIQDSGTTVLKPCRFIVDSTGLLKFSYLGNAENAGDDLVISLTYPVIDG